MKINKNTIFISLTILFIVFFAFIPAPAKANILDGPTTSVINTILANIANLFLGLTSTLVTVSGTFLNISINLSMHIGDFFNSIPALSDTWTVVRNISSMLIIFLLLYSSIMTIVGSGSTNVRKLVVQIVIAGLLINFSLFFAKLLIDASNIVSLEFYRAIAPEYANQGLSKLSSAFYDGGLSNIFMQSLKIPKIYANNSILKTTDISFSIVMATFGGMIMMIAAAFSFFAAAIAITIRTGVLLFIMAMSPLYFVSKIFPQAQDKSGKLMGMFKGQLIFMPAYLFLTYVSLKLISSPGFSSIFNQSTTAVTSEGTFGPTFIGVIIQFVIALMFIDLPLIMALSLGAMGAKWVSVPDSKSISKMLGGALGRNTLGRAANRISENNSVKDFASRSGSLGQFALSGVRNVASDYNKKLEGNIKSKTDFANTLGFDKKKVRSLESNVKFINQLKKQYGNNPLPQDISDQIKNTYGSNITTIKDASRVAGERLEEEKNRRQATFAAKIKTEKDYRTLWTQVAKDNRAAAIKIENKILEEKLSDAKESLKGISSDIKSLNNKIINLGGLNDANGNPNQAVNPAQRKQFEDLKSKEEEQNKVIRELEDRIANNK